MKKTMRFLTMSSEKGVKEILDVLQRLNEWSYSEIIILGTNQKVLKHKVESIEVYLRLDIEKGVCRTSNILPQDVKGGPTEFEKDDLFKLYKSILESDYDKTLKIEVSETLV